VQFAELQTRRPDARLLDTSTIRLRNGIAGGKMTGNVDLPGDPPPAGDDRATESHPTMSSEVNRSAEPLTAGVGPAEIPPDDNLPRPAFWGAIGWYTIFILMQVGLAIVYIAFHGGGARTLIDEDGTRLTIVNSVSVMIAAAIITVGGHGRALRKRLALRMVPVRQLLIIVLLAPPGILLDIALADTLETSPPGESGALQAECPSPPENAAVRQVAAEKLFDTVETLYGKMLEQPWPVILIFLCLLPAVGEELFFRGFLGRGLAARYGAWGVLLTSLLFGVTHLTPARICATLGLGLVLHLVYLLTKSLTAAMALHGLNNLLAFAPVKLYQQFEIDAIGLSRFDAGVPGPMLACTLVGLGGLLALLVQSRTEWTLPTGESWDAGYLTAEMPPPELGARTRIRPLNRAVTFAAGLCYLIFAAAYAGYTLL
jgi:membrane protease YdiL (CAAX protease family)